MQNLVFYSAELVFNWDDTNRFKPRTTVTTLATRGAALYIYEIGGRRSVIRRARRGCRRVLQNKQVFMNSP